MADYERHAEDGHQSELWPSPQRGVEQRADDAREDQECELLPGDLRLLLEEVRLSDNDHGSDECRAAREGSGLPSEKTATGKKAKSAG